MNMLFQAHSGIRYLVLIAGLVALLMALVGMANRKPVPSLRVMLSAFTGLLDLQVLLGAVLVVGGLFYKALIGHMVMMVLAAVIAHVGAAKAKQQTDGMQALRTRFITVFISLILIVGGITSIGRGIVGTSGPTQTASAQLSD